MDGLTSATARRGADVNRETAAQYHTAFSTLSALSSFRPLHWIHLRHCRNPRLLAMQVWTAPCPLLLLRKVLSTTEVTHGAAGAGQHRAIRGFVAS
jgi:hypothetical protein